MVSEIGNPSGKGGILQEVKQNGSSAEGKKSRSVKADSDAATAEVSGNRDAETTEVIRDPITAFSQANQLAGSIKTQAVLAVNAQANQSPGSVSNLLR